MIERKMGYRGSKSISGYPTSQPGIVKEQRVDGSWCNLLHLRCTLMGLERDYQVKIPSNQVNYYSTSLQKTKLGPN